MDLGNKPEVRNNSNSVSTWAQSKLGEVAYYINDKVNVKEISFQGYVSTENMLINKEGVVKALKMPETGKITKYSRGDILLSNIGPYLKKIWLAKHGGGCSNDVLVIRARKGIDSNFLYYCLTQDKFFDYIVAGSNYTTIPRGNKKAILEFSIPTPNFQMQIEIGKILATFDSKIENNRRINTILEQIAQTLFKRWFIDFEFPDENGQPYKSSGGEIVDSELGEIPKNWGISIFSQAIEVNPERKISKGKIAKKISMSDLDPWQSWIKKWNYESYTSGSKFKNGDTLFARITPSLEHGKTAMVHILDEDEIGYGSTEFIVFGRKEIKSDVYIFNLCRSDYIRTAAIGSMTGTSGRQRVPNYLFDQLLIVVPPEELINLFDRIVLQLFRRVFVNASEVHYLIQIKDSLLPKLISGKIRIPVRDANE